MIQVLSVLKPYCLQIEAKSTEMKQGNILEILADCSHFGKDAGL
jgi:hypothetical protein